MAIGTQKKSCNSYIYFQLQEGQVQAAGAILSSYCIQSVDTKEFFEYFDLPDTFRSWFLVSELHVYMICNRLMVGQLHDASRVKHCLMKALWEDVMERVKLLADIPTKKRKEYIMDLNFEFQVNLSNQFLLEILFQLLGLSVLPSMYQ